MAAGLGSATQSLELGGVNELGEGSSGNSDLTCDTAEEKSLPARMASTRLSFTLSEDTPRI